MPKYDLKGRAGPVTVTLGRNHRDVDMPLPHTTEDPHEIKRLLEVGCVEVGAPPKEPQNAVEALAAKPRKEVTE